MSDRATGVLLFLPVPIVLALFTQAPLGAAASLALGVVVMVTHRLYARPFAIARAARRCLWCGRAIEHGSGRVVEIDEPFGRTRWAVCTDAHHARLGGFLGWAARQGTFLKAGILGTLAVFLVAAALAAAGVLRGVSPADLVAFFRLGIALTVLPLGLLGPRARADAEPWRAPFPVHIQALIGSAAVSWLFRLVGVAWLALAVWHVVRGDNPPTHGSLP